MIGLMLTKPLISTECIIFHYWCLLEINFKYQQKVCDGCFNEYHNHYHKVFLKNVSITQLKNYVINTYLIFYFLVTNKRK